MKFNRREPIQPIEVPYLMYLHVYLPPFKCCEYIPCMYLCTSTQYPGKVQVGAALLTLEGKASYIILFPLIFIQQSSWCSGSTLRRKWAVGYIEGSGEFS